MDDLGDREAPHAHTHGLGGSPECTLCPLCALYQAVSTTRPEVGQHLIAAGWELTRAFKALVDAHADAAQHAAGDAEAGDHRLRRVDLD